MQWGLNDITDSLHTTSSRAYSLMKIMVFSFNFHYKYSTIKILSTTKPCSYFIEHTTEVWLGTVGQQTTTRFLWRHQMETFSALRAPCAGNSPVTGEFPTRSPVTRSFDVFFHLRLNKRLSKQSWGWWFETTSRSLWCHCNVNTGKGNLKVSCSLSFTKTWSVTDMASLVIENIRNIFV